VAAVGPALLLAKSAPGMPGAEHYQNGGRDNDEQHRPGLAIDRRQLGSL
jgi:hypothetical protein